MVLQGTGRFCIWKTDCFPVVYASVYVDGYDFAGGLVGKVVDNKGDQPARIENSYVGGHTSAGKFLVHRLRREENFDTTQGRYNVISRDSIAGGLAAILPSGSQVERTYVSASVLYAF